MAQTFKFDLSNWLHAKLIIEARMSREMKKAIDDEKAKRK